MDIDLPICPNCWCAADLAADGVSVSCGSCDLLNAAMAAAVDVESPYPADDREVVTYFAQAVTGGAIKIGRSRVDALTSRLSAINTGHPETVLFTRVIRGNHEAALHHRFHRQRAAGEWFHPSPDLVALANAETGDSIEQAVAVLVADAFRRGYAAGAAAAAAASAEDERLHAARHLLRRAA